MTARTPYLRFTDEGQRQNPEVPGNGPVINIDSAIARFVYSVFFDCRNSSFGSKVNFLISCISNFGDLSDPRFSYKDYKVKVEELDQGRVTINGALPSSTPSFLLTLSLIAYLTLT